MRLPSFVRAVLIEQSWPGCYGPVRRDGHTGHGQRLLESPGRRSLRPSHAGDLQPAARAGRINENCVLRIAELGPYAQTPS